MRWHRKSGIPAQARNAKNSLAVLRHAEVRSVDLAQVNAIPRLNHGVKKVDHKSPFPPGQKALHVLKDKSPRSMLGDQPGEYRNECVSVVIVAFRAGG
ncbi:MAG TPA: hypothetical protein VN541_19945 [Tepidisphaeraceae bacterium]|nr:hypothetical protein [Tepidisphaeraceae bacterium]